MKEKDVEDFVPSARLVELTCALVGEGAADSLDFRARLGGLLPSIARKSRSRGMRDVYLAHEAGLDMNFEQSLIGALGMGGSSEQWRKLVLRELQDWLNAAKGLRYQPGCAIVWDACGSIRLIPLMPPQ